MTLIVKTGFNGMTDADAIAYVNAVEAADGQLLEFAVGKAINDFVVGCKLDNTWTAIKASCILAGARTLTGALVPLVGTAPTNFNFVSGDYNRKTGLVGDGSTKYLNSNYSQGSTNQPQNSRHISAYVGASQAAAITTNILLFAQDPSNVRTAIYFTSAATLGYSTSAGGAVANTLSGSLNTIGFYGHSRADSSSYSSRVLGVSSSPITVNSISATASDYGVFGRLPAAGSLLGFSGRISFYSIGESLNLALLDARVTTLINAFAAAIP
jgi:hypothetical protein